MTPISNNAFAVNGVTLVVPANSGRMADPVNVIINNTSASTIYLGFTPQVSAASFALAPSLTAALNCANSALYLFSATPVTVNLLAGY